jgi:hypothetical protein
LTIIIKLKGIEKENINETLHLSSILKLYEYGENKKLGWYNGEMYTTSSGKNIYVYRTKKEIIIDFTKESKP